MRTQTRVFLLVGAVAGAALPGAMTVEAQYYYPPPPYGYGDGWRGWNGCPPGYTVQGGNCGAVSGPTGGGWRTWNGCPPGYTVQGGNCAPYRGPVGYPRRMVRLLRSHRIKG